MKNDFLTLIKTRRSIRAYKPDAVPADTLARVLEALVQIHRTDILFDSLRRSSGLIQALQPMVDDPARFDYFVAIITSSMIGVLTVWVEHGKTETEDQMVQKLTSAFIEMAILELPG